MPVAGVSDRPQYTVRYLPLGSPTDGPKQLFPVSRRARAWSCRRDAGAGWGAGRVGTRRVVYRVPGVGTTQRCIWYCQGQPMASTGVICVRQALQPTLWASAHLAPRTHHTRLLGPNRRDSIINILKLVDNPECHRKSVMRPVILPVSKLASNVMILNS